jgi:hypothetical protein
MSNRAKLGVWLGLPLFIIIFGSIITFILICKRSRQLRRRPLLNDYNECKAELPGNKLGIDSGEKYAGKPELDGVGIVELDNTRPPAELNISIQYAELDDMSIEMSLLGNQPVGIRRVGAKRISPAQRAARQR